MGVKRLVFLLLAAVLSVTAAAGYAAGGAADSILFSDISIDSIDAVKSSLVLSETVDGYAAVWSSDNTRVLANDGTVRRQLSDDVRVNLTVRLSDGSEKTFAITVKAFESEQELVETAAETLDFTDLSQDDTDFVAHDLTLPAAWDNGTRIIWRSDNTSLLEIVPDGENYRGVIDSTYYGEGSYGVRLSAVIYYGSAFFEKYFYLNVAEDSIAYVNSEAILAAKEKYKGEFLKRNNIFDVRSNLILPSAESEIRITYFSDNEAVVDSNGIVTRDMFFDKKVEFTVIFQRGYERTRLTLPLLIAAYSSDELKDIPMQDVKDLLAEIMRGNNLNAVTSDLTLKTQGSRGSAAIWSSNNKSVLSDKGVIRRGAEDASVTLTVTAEFKGYTYTESIELVVKREIPKTAVESSFGSGGGFGGGGFGSPNVGITEPGSDGESQRAGFVDLSSAHWAYDYIMRLAERGVVNGYEDNTFKPENNMLREEFVKTALLAAENFRPGYTSFFADVQETDWFYEYVSYAKTYGIVNGVDETHFGAGMNITREDMAVLLCRVFDISAEGQSINEEAPDAAEISDYARASVAVLYHMGILAGDTDGSFHPQQFATRAEIAKVVCMLTE